MMMELMMTPLSKLFDIRYGHSLELNRLTPLAPSLGGIPFVSRKMGDNGISSYVAKIKDVEPCPSGVLTCALSGNGVMSTFLQEKPFYSGYHIAHLIPKHELTKQQLLFYCYCLVKNRYRFSYGRQANRTLKNIKVPSLNQIPAFAKAVDVERFEGSDAPEKHIQIKQTPVTKWKSFKLKELFDVRKGQRLTKANMTSGEVPYVGASDTNNGVTSHIGQLPIHKGNTISISYNGSVAEAFYQSEPYWATDDVNVLYPKNFTLTPSAGLFICTLIRLEKYRFNYGRKWHLERMREAIIRLPVTMTNKPDWTYMENFIQTLPYSSQI